MNFITRVGALSLVVSLTNTFAAPKLVWNSGKPVLIQQDGHYGRIARLDGRTLIAGFDHRRAIKVRLSKDNGANWQAPVTVSTPTGGHLTNTEFLVLGAKDVMCLFNFRPDRNSGQAFEIRMCRSKNGGETWSATKTLFTAGKEFENGCWEPSGVVYPSGELRVFFANEAPFRDSNEQEISMIRSKDSGQTWSAAERISFRKGSRDGMPVPVIAPELKRTFVAIEDNGIHGAFKPVIVSMEDKEKDFVSGQSPHRWSALAQPLAAATYAGAPYLRRLPDRSFLLSFQIAESGKMEDSKMAVCLGDEKAGSFGTLTYPFPRTDKAQLWNSLFVKDQQAVFAVSETSVEGVRGVWMVEGRVTR